VTNHAFIVVCAVSLQSRCWCSSMITQRLPSQFCIDLDFYLSDDCLNRPSRGPAEVRTDGSMICTFLQPIRTALLSLTLRSIRHAFRSR